ncbi:hypothetical protein [Candidatus Borrarchaeum sp.]|uniref:hypothetical protein n=1 Tax=Candidatus Borrarchaeum sp. TaxID=2846742 RepID=UPI00257DA605|nr:hypothetical protein [Candidatus Borrarchaeum sp.]
MSFGVAKPIKASPDSVTVLQQDNHALESFSRDGIKVLEDNANNNPTDDSDEGATNDSDEGATNDSDEGQVGDHTEDIDNNESAEENTAETNLIVTVLINGEEAPTTTAEAPLQVSGDVVITVSIENGGPTILIEKLDIKTTTSGVQVSSFELYGATLSSGTSVDFTNTVSTGLLGSLAEIFTDPVYQSHVSIVMQNGWDYELVVYWQHI